MARFYTSGINSRGNLQGHPTPAGTDVHTRGWGAGVKVVPVGVKSEPDRFEVWMTTGSHANGADVLLGTVHDTPDGRPQFVRAGDEMSSDAAMTGAGEPADSKGTYTPGHP